MEYNREKQHVKGKLHAIERIEYILDPGSFHETGQEVSNIENEFGIPVGSIPYDGVITGFGTIHNKKVFIYSQDFTVMGGTLGKNHGLKISNTIEQAIKGRCPIIGINDSGGARIQEGVDALAGYGEIFYYNTLASGVIPQIAIIAGPCAGGAVYSPGIMDFIFNIDQISTMFVTGPKVIKSVTNEDITAQELGGSRLHMEQSGVAHFRCQTEQSCYEKVRDLLEIIPHCSKRIGTNYGQQVKKYQASLTEKKQGKIGNQPKKEKQVKIEKQIEKQQELERILPTASNRSYNIKKIIEVLFDEASFLEIQEDYSKNVVIGFVKLEGITVGVVANQPQFMAGVLDCDSSDKAARFIRYCDNFRIPIITLTDVPGFLPGTDQERKGIIRHGAKLLYAYSEATTIKLNVIIRKAYGGAYIAMSSKHLRADAVYAWPTAEIAVMGAEPACQILYAKEMKDMNEEQQKEYMEQKAMEYQQNIMSAEKAVQAGYVTAVISPSETRERLLKDLLTYSKKKKFQNLFQKKKHGNIPL